MKEQSSERLHGSGESSQNQQNLNPVKLKTETFHGPDPVFLSLFSLQFSRLSVNNNLDFCLSETGPGTFMSAFFFLDMELS